MIWFVARPFSVAIVNHLSSSHISLLAALCPITPLLIPGCIPSWFHSTQVTIAIDLSAGDSNGGSSQLSSTAGDKKRKKRSHDGITNSDVQPMATSTNYPAPVPGIQEGPQLSMSHHNMPLNPMFSYYTQQPFFNFAGPYIQQQNSMSLLLQQLARHCLSQRPIPRQCLILC